MLTNQQLAYWVKTLARRFPAIPSDEVEKMLRECWPASDATLQEKIEAGEAFYMRCKEWRVGDE